MVAKILFATLPHRLWDGLLLGSERFRSVNDRAGKRRGRAEFRRATMSELAERRFGRWAKTESFGAARQHAYRNGLLRGSADWHNRSVLPEDYVVIVRPIAERRAVLAGYRLADILRSLVDS